MGVRTNSVFGSELTFETRMISNVWTVDAIVRWCSTQLLRNHISLTSTPNKT